MDSVKVFFVLGSFAFFASVDGVAVQAQSLMRVNSKHLCQNKMVTSEHSGDQSRKSSSPALLLDGEKRGNQQTLGESEPLRAFESAGRMEGENVRLFVGALIFGVVGAIIIFFILYALMYETPEASKPYRPTEVKRGKNFVPYQHSRSNRDEDQ